MGQGAIAEIYNELHNRVDIGAKLDEVKSSIANKITEDVAQLDRVNEDAIKDALKIMQAKKQDAIFDIVYDCFINGPPELVTHLTRLMQLYSLLYLPVHLNAPCTE